MNTRTRPVRHLIWDGFVNPAADWAVPPADWHGWEVRYTSEAERGKRTTRALGGWAAGVVRQITGPKVLTACRQLFGETLAPDPLLWGGGLQVTEPGGFLGTHLDGVIHPKRPGLRRAVQLVCFVHREWRADWGGRFYFADPAGDVVERIAAEPGRLIAFESDSDLAYHGVEQTLGDAPERVTIALSLLAPARACDTRCRALFLPRR
jgi:hypothetical protein